MAEEIPLTGGNVATRVVRVGHTVRKPATQFDTATTALLAQLQKSEIAGTPRPMGHDTQGRRVLSWVDGTTEFPTTMWSDDRTLVSAAKLLRRIHDASAPLYDDPHDWAYTHPDETQHKVIGHSDFAPYNMTFAPDGSVIGVFDFNLAGPAPRSRDLAYLAWWLVPLGRQDPAMAKAANTDIAQGSVRLHKICATYGQPLADAFLEMISDVLIHMSDEAAASRMIGAKAAARLKAEGHLDHWARASIDFAEIRPQIALSIQDGQLVQSIQRDEQS
jgi:aminoglycoside phosphotransferase (APT) family kinase protein